MTTKQWYRVLLEDRVLMQTFADGTPQSLLPARVEVMSPNLDWPAIWILSRTKGLSSEQSSFIFKLLHHLLPTQDRINRITNDPGMCKLCQAATEDIHHALFSCPSNQNAAALLLSFVQVVVPDITSQAMLRLDFRQELNDIDSLAIVSILSTGLRHIWQARIEKKVVHQYKMRADIEAHISILRKTRYCGTADRMLEIII